MQHINRPRAESNTILRLFGNLPAIIHAAGRHAELLMMNPMCKLDDGMGAADRDGFLTADPRHGSNIFSAFRNDYCLD
jgi:hypothetical protein